jgi:hypothetical protein
MSTNRTYNNRNLTAGMLSFQESRPTTVRFVPRSSSSQTNRKTNKQKNQFYRRQEKKQKKILPVKDILDKVQIEVRQTYAQVLCPTAKKPVQKNNDDVSPKRNHNNLKGTTDLSSQDLRPNNESKSSRYKKQRKFDRRTAYRKSEDKQEIKPTVAPVEEKCAKNTEDHSTRKTYAQVLGASRASTSAAMNSPVTASVKFESRSSCQGHHRYNIKQNNQAYRRPERHVVNTKSKYRAIPKEVTR